jgi:hypothetical protein
VVLVLVVVGSSTDCIIVECRIKAKTGDRFFCSFLVSFFTTARQQRQPSSALMHNHDNAAAGPHLVIGGPSGGGHLPDHRPSSSILVLSFHRRIAGSHS